MRAFENVTILVVDDDEQVRETLVMHLHSLGINTLEAVDGSSAVETVKSRTDITMILSDIRMPGIDGVQMLKMMRSGNAEFPPLAFMTGYATLPAWETYELGAEAFIGKPYRTEMLSELIEELRVPAQQRWMGTNLQPTQVLDVTYGDNSPASKYGVAFGRGGLFLGGNHGVMRIGTVVRFKVKHAMQPGVVEGIGIVRWYRPNERDKLPAGCGVEIKYLEHDARHFFMTKLKGSDVIAFIPKQAVGNYGKLFD